MFVEEALHRLVEIYFYLGLEEKSKKYAKLLGYGEAATNIQKLYLTGQVSKAEELVPDQLVDLISLVGSREQVMERLSVWKTAAKEKKVSSLLLSGVLPKDMEFIAENAL